MLAIDAVLGAKTSTLQRLAHGMVEDVQILDRLRDIVPGAKLERLNGVAEVAGARDDQHREVREIAGQFRQHFQTVHPRHPQIAEHGVRPRIFAHLDAAAAIACRRRVVPAAAQVTRQHLANRAVVIDDENVRHDWPPLAPTTAVVSM